MFDRKIFPMYKKLFLDTEKRIVISSGREIKLSSKEFLLLSYLFEHKNTVVERKKLLKHIWKYAPDIETRVVDVYVGYLRRKIEPRFSKKIILSVRGSGYMLKA